MLINLPRKRHNVTVATHTIISLSESAVIMDYS